jgi:hypothetical protein
LIFVALSSAAPFGLAHFSVGFEIYWLLLTVGVVSICVTAAAPFASRFVISQMRLLRGSDRAVLHEVRAAKAGSAYASGPLVEAAPRRNFTTNELRALDSLNVLAGRSWRLEMKPRLESLPYDAVFVNRESGASVLVSVKAATAAPLDYGFFATVESLVADATHETGLLVLFYSRQDHARFWATRGSELPGMASFGHFSLKDYRLSFFRVLPSFVASSVAEVYGS